MASYNYVSDLLKRLSPFQIPLEDIKKATNNFADENLIKRGEVSYVYKGELLRSTGSIKVAIRRFGPSPPCPRVMEDSFLTEIDVVSKVKHKNIIPFVGFCDENGEMMMIFEYAVNGSLEEHLSDPTLTWSQRLNICLSVAKTMKYFNNSSSCNYGIKSSNILFDKDWKPMLSSFRLCQVSSFRKILLQVLCGRKAVEEGLAYRNLEEIIDPNLRKQMHKHALSIFSEVVFGFLDGDLDMNQIVEQLTEVLWAEEILKDFAYLKIPLDDIMLATNNFSKNYLITSHRDGTLYKAELDHFDHQTFSSSEEKNKDALPKTRSSVIIKHQKYRDIFFREIEMRNGCKNPNIASLVGFCWEDSKMILIYEGGFTSLRESLQSTSQPHLKWEQRIRICLDIMHGLKYLFNYIPPQESYPRIYSGDVLLDDMRNAKLSSSIFELQSRKLKSNGTYSNYDFSDIGVIFFEILTGQHLNSVSKIREDYFDHEKLKDIIDPRLIEEVQENIFMLYSLRAFFNIASKCLEEYRRQPPSTLKDIIEFIEKALQCQVHSFEHLQIPLADIKSATEEFAEQNNIGSGGYGKVYRGELYHFDIVKYPLSQYSMNRDKLPKKRSTVAIKRIIDNEYGKEGFLTELNVLCRNNHPNIVSLVGFCVEDHELILVYEYASNGSLDSYLEKTPKEINLTWAQRLKMCIEIAQGLYFLHTTGMENREMIIHRDIKSANILLGENWEAKITDFGLSKVHFVDQHGSTINTNTVAGTNVYLDPEYEKNGKLKKESDIYSFGVVLFEILSGKVAYDPSYFKVKRMGLAPIARQCFKEGKLNEIIDPEIMHEAHELSSTLKIGPDRNSLNVFSKIAHQCIAKRQSDRPTIEVVIKQLKKALKFQVNRKDLCKTSLDDMKLSKESFNDNNCIVKGAFGMIYNVQVQKQNGNKAVFVKRFTSSGHRPGLIREFEVLFKYKHENIIGLVGYCNEEGNEMIVYEHAANGILGRHLEDPDFTWTQRLKICIDIAKGLTFLHGGDLQKKDVVIHRDIKSSNILLTGDWKAKICGFELALISPINKGCIKYVKDGVQGYPGYCDPLYSKTGFLTKESDIYSFGVVLFEMLCGRLACLANVEDQTQYLDELVQSEHKKRRLDEIVFEGIKGQIAEKSLYTFKEIALQCLHEERGKRPSASEVIVQLQNALEFQEEYVKRMCETYGSNVAPQPLGDIHIGENVVVGRKKERLEGSGSTSSDLSYLMTGERSTSTFGSSSFTTGVTSSNEVHELQQKLQESNAKIKQLEHELEELRAREAKAQKKLTKLKKMVVSRLDHFPRPLV